MTLIKQQTPKLVDKFGRYASNLRISVIDKCNLRCRYCMPEETISWLGKDELLTFQEIKRIATITAQLGVQMLRITGGEPLMRPSVPTLIRDLYTIPGIKKISMTTNGVLLGKYLAELEEVGLSSINFSLDSLVPSKFLQITQRNNFTTVLQNLRNAINSKISVKVNTVAIRGFNDTEIIDFIDFAIHHNITTRFIEFMPFPGNAWTLDNMISATEIKSIISQKYKLIAEPLDHPSQTSRVYSIEGHPGRVGFIASVTESFCQTCNRLRLTADGNLRTCLNSKNEAPLRLLLREGISDHQLKELIQKTVWEKQKEHPNYLHPDFRPPQDDREMIRIGG